MNSDLVVWDSLVLPLGDEGQTYLWNGHGKDSCHHSLLVYVDANRERLRSKYLTWVHDLGESRIDGKRVIDHLALDDGLSYWWMTLFVEKSPWKSPSIIDAIRLFALEEIIAQQKPDKLKLVSANRNLHETLKSLCENLDIIYEWKRLPNPSSRKLSIGSINRALPNPVRALINLVLHLRACYPFKSANKEGWFSGDQSVFFCSYFDNVNAKDADRGFFHSYYWNDLHTLLSKLGSQVNWLQIFIPTETVSATRAMNWVKGFNCKRKEQGFHSFLGAYISSRIVLRILKHWFLLMFISWRLGEVKHFFRPQNSQFSLWPLMRNDWQASIFGSQAIDSLLWVELFDKAMIDMPRQNKGFYLCENQPWERGLIHAWRKHGHGQLIAVPHATIRFWDIRYFFDQRTIQSSSLYPIPQADLTALNGKVAIDAYQSVGFPIKAILECEALRYGHLNQIKFGFRKHIRGESIEVLILGDHSPVSTIKMLQLLVMAVPHISDLVTFTVKPHPNNWVKSSDYPSLNLKVIMEPLEEIFGDFDVVYAANSTSSALDAYLTGLPTVVMLDEVRLNFSPLRGQAGVRFVGTAKNLAEALQLVNPNPIDIPNINDFFFLDSELPKWHQLLIS